jgi:hypothetical protein
VNKLSTKYDLDIDELVIGSLDLKEEFGSRMGQYMHLILTD